MKKTSAYARKRRALGLPAHPSPHTIKLPVTIRFSQKHELDLQLTPHTTHLASDAEPAKAIGSHWQGLTRA